MQDDDVIRVDSEDISTCATVRSLLGELIDGALDESTLQSVQAHLDRCSECSAECEQLHAIDASLKSAFAESRLEASSVADRVLAVDGGERATPQRSLWSRVERRVALGIAALTAVCLVIAIAASFPNSPENELRLTGMDIPSEPSVGGGQVGGGQVGSSDLVDVVPVAHLVRSTGPLEYLGPNSNTWEVLAPGDISAFGCPSDTTLRTSEGAVCELQTADGATVRLNEKTEISLPSATDVELVSGEIWCETSPAKHVNIRAQQASPANDLANQWQWSVRCHDEKSSSTIQNDRGSVKVTAASGNVELTIGEKKQAVPAGSTFAVSDDDRVLVATTGDALDAVRWTQPLLAMAGHGDPELRTRVESLLAGVGATKVSWMRETDLRALGEYASVPLLEFVKGQASKDDPVKRRKAMAIASDTAPVWKVPELIALLDDDDGAIRTSAATALTRLTGQSPATAATSWTAVEDTDAVAAKQIWRAWWAANSSSCIPGDDRAGK